MSIKSWVQKKQQNIEELQQKIQKEKIEALQKIDQKRRQQKTLAEPGTIRYGLAYRQKPWEVAKDAIERRRQHREHRK